MTESLLHPTSELLEAYVEGSLQDSERVVLESHLLSCSYCQAEVEEWKALFAGLAALPHFEPGPDFADRVLAGVRLRQPWTVRVAELLRRLVPKTTVGWALVAACVALPFLVFGGVLAWLFTWPSVTPRGLWLYARERLTDAVLSLVGQAGAAVFESEVARGVVQWGRAWVATVDPSAVGAGLALFATLTLVSAWVLYQNLFRTPARERRYVSYSF